MISGAMCALQQATRVWPAVSSLIIFAIPLALLHTRKQLSKPRSSIEQQTQHMTIMQRLAFCPACKLTSVGREDGCKIVVDVAG